MAAPSRFLKLRAGEDAQSSRVQDSIDATLGPIADRLNQTPIMGAAAPAWISPSLLADFVNVTGQAPAGYHKDALGYVHGKGRVSTAAGQAANVALFVLGSGYRPKEPQSFPVRGNGATFQSLTVAVNGSVSIDVLIAAGGTVDLAFTFLAEQ